MTFSPSFLAWARAEADRPCIEADRAAARARVADLKRRGVLERIDTEARVMEPVNPDATDATLRELAAARADLMLTRIGDLCEPVTLDWLNAQVTALEARPLPPFDDKTPEADQLAARVKRACCRFWWARNVRRAACQRREAREQAAGRISVRTAPYVGDDTAARHVRQKARNLAMLERTEIESADGELLTLAAAMQASTANPAIRRGELMTRIRGAEEWAAARGMVGLFTTNTLPSRFHAQHAKGGQNVKFDGSTPRAGQGWLCKTWARARAALQRQKVQFFGFRVAEPHHDGCPHWHMLLFVGREQAQQLQDTLRAAWLRTDPKWRCMATGRRWLFTELGELEPGATVHRFKAVGIDPRKGDAAGYVAKYIAKNIDDAGTVGAEGHRDEADGEQIEIDGAGGNKAGRVLAWASAWGIRQFQSIGQPPVTVWRELRRVDASAAQGASPSLKAAHEAVNRVGDRRACWRAYMDAQGGAMQGRAHPLKLDTEEQQREGVYGPTVADWVVGVRDVRRPGEVVLSSRKQWKPRGTWTAEARDLAQRGEAGWLRDWAGFSARPKAAQPWTRVNNCTQAGRPIHAPGELMARLMAGNPQIKGPGGSSETEECPSQPPPSSNAPPAWLTLRAMLRPSADSGPI